MFHDWKVHKKVTPNFTHSLRSSKEGIYRKIIRQIRQLNKYTAGIRMPQRSLKS